MISEVGSHGGAAAVVLAMSRGAAERGWDQVVLNPFAADERGLTDYFEGVPYEALPPHHVRAFLKNQRWLRTRLRDFGPDIVHVHLVHAMFVVASLRLPAGTARVLTHHHSRYLIQHRKRAAALLERVAGRRFDCVVAPSESVRQFLVDELRFPRVTCIPNGWTGTPRFDVPKADHPTVVCAAHFRPVKGHRVLLEAFARVRTVMPDARLALLGNGPLRGELLELTRRLGLADSVEFPGTVDVWPWLARAHVFALASAYEGSPVAVLEAMAAGLPVVASEVPGNVDVVRDRETGYLAAGSDPVQFSDRIVELLRDAPMRDRMGATARRYAAEATMQRTVENYFELFNQPLSARTDAR